MMQEKKKYVVPQMDVTYFEVADVLYNDDEFEDGNETRTTDDNGGTLVDLG
jgi:hypothetical protein